MIPFNHPTFQKARPNYARERSSIVHMLTGSCMDSNKYDNGSIYDGGITAKKLFLLVTSSSQQRRVHNGETLGDSWNTLHSHEVYENRISHNHSRPSVRADD